VELARYVVEAVVVEVRSCREVARAHGVSKSWVATLPSEACPSGQSLEDLNL
jgi:transposase